MAVTRGKACVLLLAATLLGLAGTAFPCGPFFPEAVFTFSRHPDLPLEHYLRGQLGIVLPSYSRSHLYLSYRYLAGKPFTPEQLAALEGVWIRRTPAAASGGPQTAPKPPNWMKLWVEARRKIPGPNPKPPRPVNLHNPLGAYRSERIGTTYIGYYNCLSDAFRTAVHTLEERVGRFGAESSAVNSWVQAQDRVFANCSGGGNGSEKQQFLPPDASAEDSPLIRADRAYQMGAANFYAGNFEGARKIFAQIAHDPDSPWSWVAPLLVARSLIRQATVYTEPGKPDLDLLAQAETQLRKVLADSRLRRTHPSARRLLGYVQLRLRPNQRICQLREALLEATSPVSLRQDLTDYLVLLNKWPAGNGSQNRMPLAELRAEDELADWILTFQRQTPSARDHAMNKWRETGSLPWLVAAISKEQAGDANLAALLEAAEKIPQNSPAFPTIAFHRARLLAASGKGGQARSVLEQMLVKEVSLPRSSLNLVLALQMKLARNLEEMLGSARRIPARVGWNHFGYVVAEQPTDRRGRQRRPQPRWLFDADVARVLTERMPLRLLLHAAGSKSLPPNLRREVALATWVRCVLLDREKVCRDVVPILEQLAPELEGDLRRYVSAPNSPSRRFAAVFTILRFPGLHLYVGAGPARRTPLARIDNLRENWWCRLPAQGGSRIYMGYRHYRMEVAFHTPLKMIYPQKELEYPSFLSPAQKAEAATEWEQLSALETAPNHLSRQVLEWAKSHRDDPRVPQALHLAVKATRYGCLDEQTGDYSKAAFRLLHRRYPHSSWAKKTKPGFPF